MQAKPTKADPPKRNCRWFQFRRCPLTLTRAALWIVTVASLSLSSSAEEPGTISKDSKQKIETLIDKLAAKRPKPVSVKDPKHHVERLKKPDVFIPLEDDVAAAADELLKLGTQAFPYLIDHFDDDRYSFMEHDPTSEEVYVWPVGEYCFRLVRAQVMKYRPWQVADPRGTPGYSDSIVPHDKKTALEWWEKNKTHALWELQADSVQLVIKENENPRYFTFKRDERLKLAKAAIKANETLLKQLSESKTPLPTKPVRPYVDK
jgi:hypothetical protein